MDQAPDATSSMLFVRGQGARSLGAIRTVRRACGLSFGGAHALTVIDVFAAPELAEKHRVVATPTLLTLRAGTETRLVGDLCEHNVRKHFGSGGSAE